MSPLLNYCPPGEPIKRGLNYYIGNPNVPGECVRFILMWLVGEPYPIAVGERTRWKQRVSMIYLRFSVYRWRLNPWAKNPDRWTPFEYEWTTKRLDVTDD